MLDPRTPPDRAAVLLRNRYGDRPVDPGVALLIAQRAGLARASAIADAAVSHAAGPMSLSLAADVATLSRRYDEAERLAAQGLGVSSAPELHLRLATALAGQGRLADAIEHVDPLLAEEPGLEELQLARGSFLRELAGEDPPSDRGSAVLRRFHDRSALDALFERLASFPSTAQPSDALAAAAPLGRLAEEWAAMTPLASDQPCPLERLASDPATPPDLVERSEALLAQTLWGLWEVESPLLRPGVAMEDLLSGARVYAAVPAELLEGLPRWSVLLGYVTPVDGVWRAGGGFVAADPLTGRVAAHELLDGIMDSLDPEDPDSRGLLGWAEDLHERAHPLALPDDGERLTAEAFWLYQSLVRSAAPGLAEIIRGSAPVEDGPIPVPDGDAPELREWLAAWPELPQPILDDRSPLAAAGEEGMVVDVLVRCLEYELDRRGLGGEVDTTGLRQRLGVD